MSCPHCAGVQKVFGRRQAARDLRRYRKKGPDSTTQILLDALKESGVEGLTLLDIGGGVGTLQHELLKSGVSRATSADASPAYIEAAREEARRQGFEERIDYRLGDFVEHDAELEDADVVTLDRVICCYPHMHELVGRSAARARKLYGLVFPRDDWWMRPLFWIMNAALAITRNPFRVFVHPTAQVERIVESRGLKRSFCQRTASWQVMVYERA
jgi:magnesium-protoporphyrin O-methyltransferase